jgi:hypothetical protein
MTDNRSCGSCVICGDSSSPESLEATKTQSFVDVFKPREIIQSFVDANQEE